MDYSSPNLREKAGSSPDFNSHRIRVFCPPAFRNFSGTAAASVKEKYGRICFHTKNEAEKMNMEEKKRIVPEGVEEVDSEDLEDVAGGANYPRQCYRDWIHLVRDRIYFACNNRYVKPCCPKCGEVLKVRTSVQLSEEELHAAHERNHIMCPKCRWEGSDNDWVFSPKNHR
jgi:hypothetical protein